MPSLSEFSAVDGCLTKTQCEVFQQELSSSNTVLQVSIHAILIGLLKHDSNL